MDARLEITDHAVQRYIERHARGTAYPRAREQLGCLFRTATQMKSKTNAGQNLWRVVEPPMLFVVKPDDGKHVLVTVLPAGAFTDEVDQIGESDEVIAAYERIQHLVRGTKAVEQKQQVSAEVTAFKKEAADAISKLKQDFLQIRNNCRALRLDFGKLVAATSETTLSLSAADEKNLTKSALHGRLHKQTVHAKLMEENGNCKGRALAIAVGALMTIDKVDVAEVLQKIGDVDPGYLTEKFWKRA